MSDYWQKFTSHTVSRRRALAATGSAAAVAFLAACGGSDSGSGGGGEQKDATSNLYKPNDTSASAKPGGVVKHWAGADITHFDALASNSASTVGNASIFAYTRLLKFKSGMYPNVADGSVEPEMAESFEVSPDKLTVTM